MKITQFSNTINNNLNQVNNNLSKLADPSSVEKNVNRFIQDVYENSINTSLQEINNFNEAIGFIQIADSALTSIKNDINEIKSLNVRANNATLNNDNLSAINSQIEKLSQNINNTLSQTTYNEQSVFGNFNFNGVEVNTSMPRFSLDNIEDFEKSLNNAMSAIGAFNNMAVSKIDNLNEFAVNTSNSKS
ncbi:MAG TPA: hypothetical protein EYH54_04715, partial [Nautiliaceae bacterium]|nr:hypothetical protein [Nautiliaceae bacterium]